MCRTQCAIVVVHILIAQTIAGHSFDQQTKQLFVDGLTKADRIKYFGSESESGWPYYEIVDLEVHRPDGNWDVKDLNLSFSFRNDPIRLHLRPNKVLTKPTTVLTTAQERVTKVLDDRGPATSEHFVHNDDNFTAAFSTNGDDRFVRTEPNEGLSKKRNC